MLKLTQRFVELIKGKYSVAEMAHDSAFEARNLSIEFAEFLKDYELNIGRRWHLKDDLENDKYACYTTEQLFNLFLGQKEF